MKGCKIFFACLILFVLSVFGNGQSTVEEPECRSDSQCPMRHICVYDRCIIGCRTDENCRIEEACINGVCQNPCSIFGACGRNANCRPINHKPECTCPANFRGNPNVVCEQEQNKCLYKSMLPCDKGNCILRKMWCNGIKECKDGTDEKYCRVGHVSESGNINGCTEKHFMCENKRCVPVNAQCDEVNDCGDFSDEKNCRSGNEKEHTDRSEDDMKNNWIMKNGIVRKPYLETDSKSSNTTDCTEKHFTCKNNRCVPIIEECDEVNDCGDNSDEENCLLDVLCCYKNQLQIFGSLLHIWTEMKSDFSWGSFTPRAMAVLNIPEYQFEIIKADMALMKKRLDVHILLNLKLKDKQYSLVELASFINALNVYCENPRDFYGMDLVGLLRSETDIAMKTNFIFPYVLLTLCLAKEVSPGDFRSLVSMYDSHNDRGFRSLTVMAMAACISEVHTSSTKTSLEIRMNGFVRDSKHRSFKNVHETALTHRALMALGYDVEHLGCDLVRFRNKRGGFGDLLGTYYTIPVLLNTTFLNFKCKELKKEEMPIRNSSSEENVGSEISYSLWTTNGTDEVSYTRFITIEGNETLDFVMRMQSDEDKFRYSFAVDETADGKKVYEIGGVANDVEACIYWTLYRGDSAGNFREEKRGVDRIYPKDGEHFVFWRKRTSC